MSAASEAFVSKGKRLWERQTAFPRNTSRNRRSSRAAVPLDERFRSVIGEDRVNVEVPKRFLVLVQRDSIVASLELPVG